MTADIQFCPAVAVCTVGKRTTGVQRTYTDCRKHIVCALNLKVFVTIKRSAVTKWRIVRITLNINVTAVAVFIGKANNVAVACNIAVDIKVSAYNSNGDAVFNRYILVGCADCIVSGFVDVIRVNGVCICAVFAVISDMVSDSRCIYRRCRIYIASDHICKRAYWRIVWNNTVAAVVCDNTACPNRIVGISVYAVGIQNIVDSDWGRLKFDISASIHHCVRSDINTVVRYNIVARKHFCRVIKRNSAVKGDWAGTKESVVAVVAVKSRFIAVWVSVINGVAVYIKPAVVKENELTGNKICADIKFAVIVNRQIVVCNNICADINACIVFKRTVAGQISVND